MEERKFVMKCIARIRSFGSKEEEGDVALVT
jgi:hypothetical protein